MCNLDEEKIEFALGNRALVLCQGKKAENVVCFFFLTSIFAVLFVSDSWYCQIKTTRLIMFFGQMSKVY